jgi:hypothetical protein
VKVVVVVPLPGEAPPFESFSLCAGRLQLAACADGAPTVRTVSASIVARTASASHLAACGSAILV